MKRIIMVSLFLLAVNPAAYCAEASRVELNDGSVITGEIVSYANGVYVINTASLGEMKLDAAKISSIQPLNSSLVNSPAASAAGVNNPDGSKMGAYSQSLMSKPENAAIVAGLASDPHIQELVNDPQVAEAVKKGDIQALMKNEKFMQIVNDPDTQESLKKIKK